MNEGLDAVSPGGAHGATDRVREVTAALTAARARLERACRAAGRDPESVTLLPVTKFFPVSDVRILYDLGCRHFGESREQEAAAKIDQFRAAVDDASVRWDMIGNLQRNKARGVARWASAVHSVDSERLLAALDRAATASREAGERTDPLDVFVQVSLDGDPERGGAPLPELERLGTRAEEAPNLRLVGLMAVPPLGSDAETAFAELQRVHRDFVRAFPNATQLSAGMTNDLEHAVRYGSTCVRVGTALLGSRPITST
ncbi:hypothetical protein SAMN05444695_102168 [Rhodococcus triatomae]|uniref:Pyridoxal phosphate homeostasis protein n=1 Tax=Rhodococcus triatomae TaxID=300028 RepID=A0A1G8D1Y7_9NOCA|nr:YggS family pyridoxal phosphate-dependent enzyme [Rhodococcus triatomae]SDH51419.1 hypothetical protein SAMN05444695_102168 [Rhodococcus triatomae]